MSDGASLPDPAFWAGRSVLITGHTGFKGSWLAFWLAHLGAKVTGFSLPPQTNPSAFVLMEIDARLASHVGDIRDEAALADVLRRSRPEVVFHLAAQSTVRRAYADPAETFDVNIMGTVRLLEAIRRTPSVGAVVVVTSDKCYAEKRGLAPRPYVEEDSLGGSEAYAASKAGAEIVTAAFRDSFFADKAVRVATARAGNVIGGGDWTPDRLVTDLVRALDAGRALELRYPGATRPWQHVLEPLCGYLLLAERLVTGRGSYAQAWNFGPSAADVTTVEEFVARFERAWGATASRTCGAAFNPHESLHLLLDSTAASRELGWRCRLSLDNAIAWTVEWFEAIRDTNRAAAITTAQLERYKTLAAPALPAVLIPAQT